MMRRRLRIILPIINLVIAIVLLSWSRLKSYTDLWEMFLCQWINTPATLAHKLIMSVWSKAVIARLSSSTVTRLEYELGILDASVYLILVFATWYIVGLELETKGGDKLVIVPSSKLGRVIMDGLIVLVGIVLILSEIEHWTRDYFSAWVFLRAALHLSWAFLFIVIYGRDLIRSVSKTPVKA